MNRTEYLKGIGQLYAAEVLGEALASRWLELATDPQQKYKLGLFLQLESEAKVRLRPLLARYGISLVEESSQRKAGAEAAEQFATQPWREAMATLSKLAVPYADRFRSLLASALPEDVPLVRFMVDHEESVSRIAEREAMGEPAMESDLVVMLAHPFSRAAADQR
jgi:xanthine/CO dehydrogenase XdhC/CoxF family maturation factor